MANKFILVLGGARSGKSKFAQDLAKNFGEKVLFVATGAPLDEEMTLRIEAHKRSRPKSWQTLEISVNVGQSLPRESGDAEVVLLDCLTLLVSNVILKPLNFGSSEGEVEDNYLGSLKAPPPRHRQLSEAISEAEIQVMTELEQLIDFIDKYKGNFIVVSNEVGLGLVPENNLGRVYRDLLGNANQFLAQHATDVYFMVSGIPVKVR